MPKQTKSSKRASPKEFKPVVAKPKRGASPSSKKKLEGNLTRKCAILQAANTGSQKLRRLFLAIQDLTRTSNRDLLYPYLANHMVNKEEREQARTEIQRGGGWQLNRLSESCQLLWFYVNYNKKRFVEEINRSQLTPLHPKNLGMLPIAAEQASFSRNFNMAEDFALFSYKLMPIFLTCKTTKLLNSTKSSTLSACYVDGTPVLEDLGIKAGVEETVKELARASAEHAKQNLPLKRGNWGALSVQPPARLLGVTTWEHFEEDGLAEAIQALEEDLSSKGKASFQGGGKVLVGTRQWMREWLSDEGKGDELRYYSSILELMREANGSRNDERGRDSSGLRAGSLFEPAKPLSLSDVADELLARKTAERARDAGQMGDRLNKPGGAPEGRVETVSAVLIPSFEGISYACSKKVLSFMHQGLQNKLVKAPPGGSQGAWNAQSRVYDGGLLAKTWKMEVSLSSLLASTAPVNPSQALRSFRDAIEGQERLFDARFWETLHRFWQGALRSAPDYAPLKDLIARLFDEPPALDGPADDRTDGTASIADANGFLLRERLERLHPLQDGRWPPMQAPFRLKLLDQVNDASSVQLDRGASRLLGMARRLETFWVNEYGAVRALGPAGEKERAPDGTWKRGFGKYINQVSAEIVRASLEQFAKAVSGEEIDLPSQDGP